MATRVRNVLVDATVEADLDGGLSRWRRFTPEERARELERLCQEFNDFIRDHRSMDYVSLSVNRVVRDECSACRSEWEPDGDLCANCGETLELTPDAGKDDTVAEAYPVAYRNLIDAAMDAEVDAARASERGADISTPSPRIVCPIVGPLCFGCDACGT